MGQIVVVGTKRRIRPRWLGPIESIRALFIRRWWLGVEATSPVLTSSGKRWWLEFVVSPGTLPSTAER